MLFIRVKLSTCSVLSPSPQGEGIGVRLPPATVNIIRNDLLFRFYLIINFLEQVKVDLFKIIP